MANPEHVAIIRKGVTVWNEWRRDAMASGSGVLVPDLTGADLQSVDLRRADLFIVQLNEANLTGADLRFADIRSASLIDTAAVGAKFNGADLAGANLNTADLRRTELFQTILLGADLSRADLREALLINTVLDGATLTGSNMTGAHLNSAIFTGVNFKDAIGLDECLHLGPCAIDFRTLVQSGDMPRRFLQGCGLPDSLIDHLPSLLTNAIQFYSCFISHSTEDKLFADRLYTDLRAKGVRCWFAPHNIQGGKKIYEQIDEAICLYDRLLVILSEQSMNSEWVKTEIAHARQKELTTGRQVLFPISLVSFAKIREWKCFDADTGKDSAREVREYFIPDFSNWKEHDWYEKAFDQLLRDLEAGAKETKTAPDGAAD